MTSGCLETFWWLLRLAKPFLFIVLKTIGGTLALLFTAQVSVLPNVIKGICSYSTQNYVERKLTSCHRSKLIDQSEEATF